MLEKHSIEELLGYVVESAVIHGRKHSLNESQLSINSLEKLIIGHTEYIAKILGFLDTPNLSVITGVYAGSLAYGLLANISVPDNQRIFEMAQHVEHVSPVDYPAVYLTLNLLLNTKPDCRCVPKSKIYRLIGKVISKYKQNADGP